MSTQFHRAAMAASTAVLFGVIVGCSTSTGGTAAVGTDFTPASSSAAKTTTTATTTRSSRPTTSSASTSSAASTSAATTSAAPATTTASPMPTTTTALVVGDCYTVAANGDALGIDCSQLHDGQVFQTDLIPRGVDPFETDGGKLFDSARGDCAAAFEKFTGAALDSDAAKYTLGLLISSPRAAATVLSCTAVDKNAAQWAGTAEDVSGSYQGIAVGDCFDYPTTTSDAVKLACDQPHDGEMYLLDAPLGLDAADAPYPTDAQWQDLSKTICVGPFTDYTGLPFDTSTTLSFSYVYPRTDDWSDVSRRTISCVVIEENGTKLVGSKHS